MASKACPCGSGEPDVACCQMYIDGVPAPTALALMRSRYTAFVRGAIDYLMETHDASTRGTVDRAGLAAWSRDTLWLGLEIVATEKGGEDDSEGYVEFIARGATKGQPFAQRERSRFRRGDPGSRSESGSLHIGGRWYYVDGKIGRA